VPSKAGFISDDPLMGIPRHAFMGSRIVAEMTCCTPESKNRLKMRFGLAHGSTPDSAAKPQTL
jgi:hypothetical protein